MEKLRILAQRAQDGMDEILNSSDRSEEIKRKLFAHHATNRLSAEMLRGLWEEQVRLASKQ